MTPTIIIKSQNRKSLAMRLTPAGVEVLVPRHLDVGDERVQRFVARELDRLELPEPLPVAERLDKAAVLALVEQWAGRLGVTVRRVRVQPMRRKWGSLSTAGNLTLAAELLQLPRPLVEYVVCHELLHLKVAHHNRLYYLLLAQHIPDWQAREQALGRWAVVVGASDEE